MKRNTVGTSQYGGEVQLGDVAVIGIRAHVNYLYADGHVDAIPAEQIRTGATSGFNFALP